MGVRMVSTITASGICASWDERWTGRGMVRRRAPPPRLGSGRMARPTPPRVRMPRVRRPGRASQDSGEATTPDEAKPGPSEATGTKSGTEAKSGTAAKSGTEAKSGTAAEQAKDPNQPQLPEQSAPTRTKGADL